MPRKTKSDLSAVSRAARKIRPYRVCRTAKKSSIEFLKAQAMRAMKGSYFDSEMGRTCECLYPSEALPGFGVHNVIFHNGVGYYYNCVEFSLLPEKRLFECVRPECKVTARMGSGAGCPLIDQGSHTHPADPTYRDQCIMLHTIRLRLVQGDTPASLNIQELLSSFSTVEKNPVSPPCNFESVILEEMPIEIKEEPVMDPMISEDDMLEELCEPHLLLPPVKIDYDSCTSQKENASTPEPSSNQSPLDQMEFVTVNTEENTTEQNQVLCEPQQVQCIKDDVATPCDDGESFNKKQRLMAIFPNSKSKQCAVCSDNKSGNRRETINYCETCTRKPGLHIGDGFKKHYIPKDIVKYKDVPGRKPRCNYCPVRKNRFTPFKCNVCERSICKEHTAETKYWCHNCRAQETIT